MYAMMKPVPGGSIPGVILSLFLFFLIEFMNVSYKIWKSLVWIKKFISGKILLYGD